MGKWVPVSVRAERFSLVCYIFGSTSFTLTRELRWSRNEINVPVARGNNVGAPRASLSDEQFERYI